MPSATGISLYQTSLPAIRGAAPLQVRSWEQLASPNVYPNHTSICLTGMYAWQVSSKIVRLFMSLQIITSASSRNRTRILRWVTSSTSCVACLPPSRSFASAPFHSHLLSALLPRHPFLAPPPFRRQGIALGKPLAYEESHKTSLEPYGMVTTHWWGLRADQLKLICLPLLNTYFPP